MLRSDLEAQAEVLYPMPERCCDWKRKKIIWLRMKWVEKATQQSDNNKTSEYSGQPSI